MKEIITKSGIVREILHAEAVVIIDCDTGACSGCRAAFLCGKGSSETAITVKIVPGLQVSRGDSVEIEGRVSHRLFGTFLLVGLPAIIIVAVVAGCSLRGANDIISGLSAIGALVFYYLILTFLRKRLLQQVEWTITRTLTRKGIKQF